MADGSSCVGEGVGCFGLGVEASFAALASFAGGGVVAEVVDVLPLGASVFGLVFGDSGLASGHRVVPSLVSGWWRWLLAASLSADESGATWSARRPQAEDERGCGRGAVVNRRAGNHCGGQVVLRWMGGRLPWTRRAWPVLMPRRTLAGVSWTMVGVGEVWSARWWLRTPGWCSWPRRVVR